MGNEMKYDVVVLGAGSMGTAAGYFLAKQNKKVLMIDQFSVPNSMASHAGETRMFRFGYGQGEKYIPLVLEAHKLWKELEELSGKKLFYQTGALMAGKSGSTFVKETVQSSQKNNLPIEELTAEMVMERWPGIQIPEDFEACYDPLSGFVLCEECITTYKEEALKLGAELLENTPVQSFSLGLDKVEMITDNGTIVADHLVVTAGAWIPKLLNKIDLPIKVLRKPAAWFTPDPEGKFDHGKFPVFVFDTLDGHYYGFPNFRNTGLKIGRHDTGIETNADKVDRTFGSYCEDEGDLKGFLNKYMPDAANDLADGKVCLYSLTPDSDFIIDFHPNYRNVVIAGGFSGHGFKFASVVGNILADLTIDGETKHDISFFRLNRFQGAELAKN
ncbi:N-methyl-L-tryptophan oxidase [Neobacillus sp. LXY-4]|uniref:N-methyl-L-tryptophan oxidase n=1 Tax=Neobacillus sp. LXY-4 TaxID=3379826 RepID=UPI003EE24F5F